MDAHQQRYLAHQQKKRDELNGMIPVQTRQYSENEKNTMLAVISNRKSSRTFNAPISSTDMLALIDSGTKAPSSCNRKAVFTRLVKDADDIKLLSDLLVGGIGWVEKASDVILLLANMSAYKAPGELLYMPYLDAGFMAQNIYLTAEVLGVSACFVNPNIRDENLQKFNDNFVPDGHMFCGAMAVG